MLYKFGSNVNILNKINITFGSKFLIGLIIDIFALYMTQIPIFQNRHERCVNVILLVATKYLCMPFLFLAFNSERVIMGNVHLII